MQVKIEVKKVADNTLYLHELVGTLGDDGSRVISTVPNRNIVVELKGEHEGKYAFEVQALVDGLIDHLKGEKDAV